MTGNTFTREFTLPPYLSDRYRNIPLTTLSSILVSVLGQQSEELGQEAELEAYFKEKNLSWIILKFDMDIDRQPNAGEKLRVETYATGYNKLFCYRQIDAYDEQGDLVVQSTVTYAWFDMTKRKLARLDPDIMTLYGADYEKRIRRMKTPEFDPDQASEEDHFEVTYFDIDINNHVNFTIYFKWAIQSLGVDFMNRHRVQSLSIKYDKEVLEGEEVTVKTSLSPEEDGQVQTISKVESSRDNATVVLDWVQRQNQD